MSQKAATVEITPLESLVTEHSTAVFRYLRSVLGNEETAKDLLHDTFLKLSPYAAEAGKALVFTVARTCALDYLRKSRTIRKYETRIEADPLIGRGDRSQDRPDRQLAASTLRQDLLAALEKLPEDQRTVFHLSEIEGLSYAAIAEVLGVSPGTIASRKHHAVRKLRRTLAGRGHG